MKIFVDLGLSPSALETLQNGTSGHQLLFPQNPTSSVLAKADPDPLLADADIAFGQPDTKAIEGAEHLRWIHVSSSGITRYDNPQFRQLMAERRIPVTNSASVYCEPCAVHVLSFILAQTRNLPAALTTRTENGSRTWKDLRHTSSTLRGETVLILGFGAIGKRLTELLLPFKVKVIAYRRQARGDEGVPVVTENQLPATLREADHIVNILPDSPETRDFFNSARFAGIKPGATFYNIGRGTTVDQNALVEALRSGRIKAAWLDVTDPEPLPADHPLLNEPNCFITPHIAGGHQDETKSLVLHFLENFKRFINNEPLRDRVM